MKRPIKPKMKITSKVIIEDYELDDMILSDLLSTLIAMKVPLEEVKFEKSWPPYEHESIMQVVRIVKDSEKQYEKAMEKYNQELADYYRWKAEQLEKESPHD